LNIWKIIGKTILNAVAITVILLIFLHLGVTAWYVSFFMDARGEFLVPGLDTSFVQQGFDYVTGEDVYLVSGYMDNQSPSRIYIRDAQGETRFVSLKNKDGSDYLDHSGGICHNGEYVYVAADGGFGVLELTDVLDGGEATVIGRIETGFDVSCCTVYNGHLLGGEFYRDGSHETDPSHRQTTPNGTWNPALIVAYPLDEGTLFGVSATPVGAISAPGLVQGFCFTSTNELVLSTSYGMKSSHLYYHTLNTANAGAIELGGVEVPLIYLDETTLTHEVKLPPMSEEILCRDGAVYIMNESASNKYIFGKFIRGYQVFSYERKGES